MTPPMLPNCADPSENVSVFADYQGELRASCDVVVVGSGPGGAVVAKELAEVGRDVILLEEGPPYGQKDFIAEPGELTQRYFREGGTRSSIGNVVIPTMQASALGGGSVFNSAICARPPAWVFDRWADRTGTRALSLETLMPHFERVEAQLGIAPTPEEALGQRNLLFKLGCDRLGISSEPTPRNVQGCKGSSECYTGCRNNAKKSLDLTYVPAAIRAGARVFTSVRAERIVKDGRGRATAVRGHIVEPFTERECGQVDIATKAVVLAAGCMASPVILARSGIGNGHVGKHLQLHPGMAFYAVYPEPIDPWQGATQGYHSLEYLEQGMKFEVLWGPPSVLATRLPGIGLPYQERLRRFSHYGCFDVIIAAEHSTGSVRPRLGSWHPDVRWHFDKRDVRRFQESAVILSDICWASGVEAVLPGMYGFPEVMHSKKEADELFRKRKMGAADAIIVANHAFGTTRMSREPAHGVVDEMGRCHEADNVYVADTGVFVGSPAVNPMHTCMALADYVAKGIAESW